MNTFGILAFPAHHSLSPQMHNRAFSEIGDTNSFYTRFEISPENLEKFMNEKKFSGLSVSVPHKESIMRFVDTIDESAEKIGAVNTVYTKHGKTIGTNTDWIGFTKSLEEHEEISGKNFLVLGAGGASRAIIFGLIQKNAGKIFVWNRNHEKARILAKEFSSLGKISAVDDVFFVQNKVNIVINTTSVGMCGKLENISPLEKNFWKKTHTAFDIVYTPKNTVFLQDAKEMGAKGISGEKMLLFQGAEQFKIFSGKNAPVKAMEEALFHKKNSWSSPKISESEKKNILQTICKHTEKKLWKSKEFWNESGVFPRPDFAFYNALRIEKNSPHLIAEIKPASPSKGEIFSSIDRVENIATLYETFGATCISVLTDETFFGASIENLKKARKTVQIPLLRKDFILHESQIHEAFFHGADAVLLMKSVLGVEKIQEFLEICHQKKRDALVEVHDEKELMDVLQNTSARIIGVNTRDLKTLNINPKNFQTLLEKAKNFLGEERFQEKIWVAESGISSKEDIENFAKNANATLVGTGILQSENREEKVKELSGE